MINLEELTPEQKAENNIAAMEHSIDAIFAAIGQCAHTEEEHSIIDRNVGHLEHMLLQDRIANHPSDKSKFYSAITLGKEHLA